MTSKMLLALFAVLVAARPAAATGQIDLSRAVIVVDRSQPRRLKAAEMLRDEIEKRTRIRLRMVEALPDGDRPTIVVGTVSELRPPADIKVPEKPEAFAIWVDSRKPRAPVVCLAGRDDRGVLYAAGWLLRNLQMARDKLSLDGKLSVATAPAYPLRGHQVGFRPKTNAYDAWTVEMWEQYFRDMIVFGTNAVELIPPRSDDDLDSPHFTLPPMKMMIEMSKLADQYDLDVWIWYPVLDDDDLSAEAVEQALKERDEVFSKLPRIDAVFVPGGDPGEVHPKQLLPLMREQKKVLNKYHPEAQIWVSPQGFDWDDDGIGWLKVFYEMLEKEQPEWLDGVVYGPQVSDTISAVRSRLPSRYPIRRYPDITHCLDSQYAVPDWDPAFHATLYREPINPRPLGYAKIFRDWDEYTIGFITYSEGVNDDLNKFIWGCLGWDPETKVEEILRQYSRYFISGRFEERFTQGLLGLERNWQGPLGSVGPRAELAGTTLDECRGV
jgi:hypothetical protein